jgi:thioesterase domain-containing protein
MAAQLQAAGREVASLTLIDSEAPGVTARRASRTPRLRRCNG